MIPCIIHDIYVLSMRQPRTKRLHEIIDNFNALLCKLKDCAAGPSRGSSVEGANPPQNQGRTFKVHFLFLHPLQNDDGAGKSYNIK